MVRFSQIIVAYFVMGAVMWAGGAIAWDEAGVGTLFVDDPDASGQVDVDDDTADDLEGAGGPIQEAASAAGVGGGLLAVWNLIVKVISSLFWPIITLDGLGAPASVTVIIGGTPTVAFWGAVLRVLRDSV
jgi:hypothetical protein